MFQRSILIVDIATYGQKLPKGQYSENHGRGGDHSKLLLARMVLGVVWYIKNANIFEKVQNWIFTPRTRGLKLRPPHYMAKNENHARVLFDSLNEAFWCSDYNAKNLSSLRSSISEKIRKVRQKWPFFQKWPFLWFFLIFSEMGLHRELRFFAL